MSEAVIFDMDKNGDHVGILKEVPSLPDYRPTEEFKQAVQDVLERRKNMTYSDVIPLSRAIDNECARRGIIR